MDCPPTLGLLTVNALVASDRVVAPVQTQFYALRGLKLLIETIEKVQRLHPNRSKLHLLPTMFDSRQIADKDVLRVLEDCFAENLIKSKDGSIVIPKNIRLSEAASAGQPINIFDPECSGARAYEALAKEVLSW